MVKRAVLVGCNYPGSKAALNGCVNDVKAIKEVLLKHKGFLEKDITVMIDTDPAAIQPTGKNIRHAIKEMVTATKAGDVIFFHFSGHGTQVPSSTGEVDGKDEAICPTDMNLIIDNDLRLLFEHVDKQADLTVICDCCHSGGIMDHTTVQIGEGDNGRGPPPGVNMGGFLSMLTGGGGGGAAAAPAPQQSSGGGSAMSLLNALAGGGASHPPQQQQQQQGGGMGSLLGALAGASQPQYQQQQQYPPQQQQQGGGMGSLLGALVGGPKPPQQQQQQQQGGGMGSLLGALAGAGGGGQSGGGMGGLGAMMGMLGGGGGGQGGFGLSSLLGIMLANSIPARDVNLTARSLPIQTVCEILGHNSSRDMNIAPTDIRQALADIFQKTATPSVRSLAPQGCVGVVMRLLMGGGSNAGSQTNMSAQPTHGAAAIDPSDPVAGLAQYDASRPAAAASASRGHENTVLVSGCESHQTSADACPSGNPSKAFGALTNSLCTVINQNPDVSAYELVAASRQLLGQGGYSQRPTLECENQIAARPFICATIHSI